MSFPTFLLAGLLVGGVGLADPGAELFADEFAAQETVDTFPAGALGREVGGGRPGNGFVLLEVGEEEVFEAVPQERVCETEERLD